MPPMFGKRDESSITTNPCGTKKKIAAITHRTSVTGPALAEVARCRRPSTAKVHQNDVTKLERSDELDRLRGSSFRLRSHKPRKKEIRINEQEWESFSLKG